jgi:hypothetical protein
VHGDEKQKVDFSAKPVIEASFLKSRLFDQPDPSRFFEKSINRKIEKSTFRQSRRLRSIFRKVDFSTAQLRLLPLVGVLPLSKVKQGPCSEIGPPPGGLADS